MLQTVDINMDQSQQQHTGSHDCPTMSSGSATSLNNAMKQMTTDSNNNIESKSDAYATDSNNNAINMASQNGSDSHDGLLYDEQKQQQQQQSLNNSAHHHELSDQEANSLINGYCSNGGVDNSKTNLIVNYLPQNMNQEEIKELFSSIGPVESCKLIKDKLTGQSLGYAFVNFANQEDADKAIFNLNGMHLQNKTIKVSLARPSSELIKGANLYICGLPKTFTQMELEKMFTDFGTIISSKILTDPKTSESKGVGFVRFDKRPEAEIAIEKLNGKTYENISEPLVVKFANSPTSVKSVMGLPLTPFIPAACRGFYQQPYRSTSNSNYRYPHMNAPAPPLSAGYCASVDPTAAANTLLHHHHLNGLPNAPLSGNPSLTTSSTAPTLTTLGGVGPLLANGAQAGNPNTQPIGAGAAVSAGASATSPTGAMLQSPPPTSLSSHSLSSINYSGWCIFVYNLGPESDESLLWQLFGPFGAVQSVKVIRDMQSHKCKGFGFVTMTNYDEAVTAINCLNGLNLQNRILQVSFKTNAKQHMF